MLYKDQKNNVVHDFRDVSETAASRLSSKSRYKRKQIEHITSMHPQEELNTVQTSLEQRPPGRDRVKVLVTSQ